MTTIEEHNARIAEMKAVEQCLRAIVAGESGDRPDELNAGKIASEALKKIDAG